MVSSCVTFLTGLTIKDEFDTYQTQPSEVNAEVDWNLNEVKMERLTFDEAEAALSQHKIWYAPVQNYSDLAADPQANHNRVFGKVSINGGEATLINHPNRYDGDAPPTRHIAARAGQDSRQVLTEIGVSEDTITSLLENNDIA